MRRLWLPVVLAAALLALFVSPTAAADEGTITVVHGVPGLTVDVYVNNQATLKNFAPDTITDPIKLPAGDYKIDIRPAGAAASTAPAISGTASLPAGANASIVAHLSESGSPTLSVFVNDVSTLPAGKARLTVRHTAAAPAVDVLAGGKALISNLANPKEAKASVDAGAYAVSVAPTGTTQAVIGPANLTLNAGAAYMVYAVGSAKDGNLHLLVQSVSGLGGTPSGANAGASGLAAMTSFSVLGIGVMALLLLGAGGSALAMARARR
jgi:hypothetical protein